MSIDSVFVHKMWNDNELSKMVDGGVPFPMLSDASGKIGRLYGAWMHIATLPKGEVTVKATLNANDHRPLSIDGQLIEQTLSLTN